MFFLGIPLNNGKNKRSINLDAEGIETVESFFVLSQRQFHWSVSTELKLDIKPGAFAIPLFRRDTCSANNTYNNNDALVFTKNTMK